jgi:hypothetical protein
MSLKKLLTIAVLVVILLCIGAFILIRSVQNELPGDRFYGLKTASERMFGGIQLTNTGRVEHNISLLESRLNELNRYALGISTSTPDQLSKIAEQSDMTTKDALNLIAGDKSMDAATRITLLAKIDGVVRAQVTLGDSIKTFSPITDNIASNEKRANEALKTAITDFVSQNASDTIELFIAEKISSLGQSIKAIAPGSSAAKTVNDRVNDTKEALVDHNYKDAIIAIIHAEQAVAIDGYLFNAERGPVEGVPMDTGPIPEGN